MTRITTTGRDAWTRPLPHQQTDAERRRIHGPLRAPMCTARYWWQRWRG